MDKLPAFTEGMTQRVDNHDGRTSVHLFDEKSVLAVNTALACGRPLLVRGEPGTGKSQLAAAVAAKIGGASLKYVVDARTDPHDLMWRYDAVGRLADAQAYGARLASNENEPPPARRNYIEPGPLWWAFDWKGANEFLDQTGRDPNPGDAQGGVVLLIDEIDKASAAVPNALLESLGSGRFVVDGWGPVSKTKPEPLIMLTTNTDRALPDAFTRRCVVLHLSVPTNEAELVTWLMRRGRVHFKPAELDDGQLRAAAKLVAKGRTAALAAGIYSPPGLAEYIDLLAAVERDPALDIDRIGKFFLAKHADPDPPGHER